MIVGIDVSSRRIDLAWLEDGKPQRWHQELAKGHLIDRLRSIRIEWPCDEPSIFTVNSGSTFTCQTNPNWQPGGGITDIAVEYPFGRGNAIAALMSTVGVITRQAPTWARVAWPSAGELRQAIGAKNNKAAAHEAICALFPDTAGSYYTGTTTQWSWDEHELDALVACLGWTAILAAQDDA